MLVAVIKVSDLQTTRQQIKEAQQHADGIELRLDYAVTLDINFMTELRRTINLPIIFTLRKKSQGGFYSHTESQRLSDLFALCQLNPEYIDIEYDVSADFLEKIKSHYPKVKLICSYHNFKETPEDLMGIFESLQHPCFYAYKIATHANNTLDALRMLKLVSTLHKQSILTGICMGEAGQCTRVLSPIVGNAMNYASLEAAHATAPGQLTLAELLIDYRIKKLNKQSRIYATLTDDQKQVLYNQIIELLNENAVYIKLHADQVSLGEIIRECSHLPFAGFSTGTENIFTQIKHWFQPGEKYWRRINELVKQHEA